MKPLGKAVQVALDPNKLVQEAMDDLLIDYRSTTGLAPGGEVSRGGYHSRFLRRPLSQSNISKKPKNATRDAKPRPIPNEMRPDGDSITTSFKATKSWPCASQGRQNSNPSMKNSVYCHRCQGDTIDTSFMRCKTFKAGNSLPHESQIKLHEQLAQTMPHHSRPTETKPYRPLTSSSNNPASTGHP